MSRLRYIIIVVVAIVSAGASRASAQQWIGVNRDDFGNVVKGSYLTNEWFDNWYVEIAGGATAAFSEINNPVVTPQFDFSILKWFTPSIGARFGYQGFTGKEYLTVGYNPWQINHSPLPFDGPAGGQGTLSYGMAYFHGDFMWNISNAFWGYKYQRFWDTSIYANAGYVRLYDNTDGQGFRSPNRDNEFAFGLGIYNAFRVTERLHATFDIRHYSTASRYKTLDGVRTNHFAGFVGLAYNIYRTYWNRAQSIISENAIAKADAAAAQEALDRANNNLADLQNRVAEKEAEIAAKNEEIATKDAELATKNEELAKRSEPVKAQEEPVKVVTNLDDSKTTVEVPYEVLKARADVADLVLYFYINVDKLNFSELHHLDAFVQETLKNDPDHVFYLTGSADKGTGSLVRNTFLCRSRAYGVRDILIRDYGIKESNIVIKSTIISDKHLDGALDRCVIIERE